MKRIISFLTRVELEKSLCHKQSYTGTKFKTMTKTTLVNANNSGCVFWAGVFFSCKALILIVLFCDSSCFSEFKNIEFSKLLAKLNNQSKLISYLSRFFSVVSKKTNKIIYSSVVSTILQVLVNNATYHCYFLVCSLVLLKVLTFYLLIMMNTNFKVYFVLIRFISVNQNTFCSKTFNAL